MPTGKQKKIIRLLGVGFDAEDGHVRITNAEKYDVLMGSHESHEFMAELIRKIEQELEMRAMDMDDLSPDELSEMIKKIL